MTGYNIATNESLNPVRLAQAGQLFDRLNRVVGRWAWMAREQVSKWPANKSVRPIGDVKNPDMSGALIESLADTSGEQGGDWIKVPIMGHLSKAPIGDAEAEGLGEELPFAERQLRLAMHRKPIKLATKMQAQRLPQQLLSAVNNPRGHLMQWWADYFDGNVNHTLCTGYDVMLTNARKLKGQSTSSTPFSHPNMLVAGSGQVTYSNGRPGTTGYETSTRDALSALKNDPTKGMTCDRVKWAQQWAADNAVPRWMTPWGEFTTWAIDPWQAYQLTQDPLWRSDNQLAGERGRGNPLFSREFLLWEGNLFFIFPSLFGVPFDGDEVKINPNTTSNTAANMPWYGPSNFWIHPEGIVSDQNPIKIAFILSPGTLYRLYGRKRFEFNDQDGDFKRRQEVLLEAYQSLVRGDMWDSRDDFGYGAGAFFKNTSSVAVATWSPATAMP